MIKRLAYGLMILSGIGLLTACASGKKSLGQALQTSDVVFEGTAEPVPSKINVYTTMARSAKYNSDAASRNMLKKIYDTENPKEIVLGILNSGSNNKLLNAARALDFADIYAMSILTDNQKFIENTLYAKSAQNLSVEAIKLHRQEIFAEKKIKEIDRLLAPQEKILNKLIAKNDSGEGLTEPEINYRKRLEVALNRLEEMKNQLLMVRSEYAHLINTENKDLTLEGKRFYELDDFDKKYTIDIFQDSAVVNRREFSLAKEQMGSFNAAKARRQAYVDYPPVARLDINGLEVEDSRYENELFNKAKRAALNLIDAVEAYQAKSSSKIMQQEAFDELAAVVMTQVELMYRLVQKSTFEYDANSYKILETKDYIKILEKKKNLSDYEKTDLLNLKTNLIAEEKFESDVLAERAASLRNLYYLAGLSPFEKNVLKKKISDIEVVLKHAFNRDLIDMLSAVKDSPRWDDGGNAWAHKDNWLEELVEDPQKAKKESKAAVKKEVESIASEDIEERKVSNVKTAKRETYFSGSGNNYTVMQLGAYQDMQNALDDLNEIKENVQALKGYDIFVEDGEVNGILYHRLLVKPEPEKLSDLCQKVIDGGFDCMLK